MYVCVGSKEGSKCMKIRRPNCGAMGKGRMRYHEAINASHYIVENIQMKGFLPKTSIFSSFNDVDD